MSDDFLSILRERQPRNDTGIYLEKHEHDWIEVGAHRWPSGNWDPVFQCLVCTDVICTEAVPRSTRVRVTWADHGGEHHIAIIEEREIEEFRQMLAERHSIVFRIERVR